MTLTSCNGSKSALWAKLSLHDNKANVTVFLLPTVLQSPIKSNRRREIQVTPHARLSVDDANAHLAAGIACLGMLQAPAHMLLNALDSRNLLRHYCNWQLRRSSCM